MEIPEQETEFRHYFYVRRRGKKNVMLAQKHVEEEKQNRIESPKRTLLYLFVSHIAPDEMEQLRSVILKRNTTVVVCYQNEETGQRIFDLLGIMLQDNDFQDMVDKGKIQFSQFYKISKEEPMPYRNETFDYEYQLKRSYQICWEVDKNSAMVSCGGYFFEIQKEEGKIQNFQFEPVDYFISLLEFMNQRGLYPGYVQLAGCKEQKNRHLPEKQFADKQVTDVQPAESEAQTELLVHLIYWISEKQDDYIMSTDKIGKNNAIQQEKSINDIQHCSRNTENATRTAHPGETFLESRILPSVKFVEEKALEPEEFLAMFETDLNGIPIRVGSFEVKNR